MTRASMVAAAVFVVGQAAPMGASMGCLPAASEDDAGIRPGDGGVWVTSDGGTWFVPSNPLETPLRATPKLEMLCMLRGGKLTGDSDYEESSQGIWIGDIPMILGDHGVGSQDSEGAEMTFAYALPEAGADVVVQETARDGKRPKRVTLSLAFERIDAVWAPISDRVPMKNPYFVTRVDATGIEPPECWSSASDAVTTCDACKRSGRDFFLCKDISDQMEDCYAR